MDDIAGIADLDPNALFVASLTSDRQVEDQLAEIHGKLDELPLSAEDKKEILQKMAGVLDADAMRGMSARILTAYYTPEELVDMAAFYRSPVGRKSLVVAPKILADITDVMSPKLVALLALMFEKLEALEE